jgi:hypothetical protein
LQSRADRTVPLLCLRRHLAVNGIRELSNPLGAVLQELHAPVWVGAIMAVVGVIFTYTDRPGTQG